nr:uncharacterized protein LOC110560662 [Meriones unguiculatus]
MYTFARIYLRESTPSRGQIRFVPPCSHPCGPGPRLGERVFLKGTQRPLLAPGGPTQTIESLDLAFEQPPQAPAHPERAVRLRWEVGLPSSGRARAETETEETGPGAERRAAVGGAASAGGSRASPVAGSEHSPAEEAARGPRTSAPSPAGRGKAAGGAELGTPLNLSHGAGAIEGAVRPRAVAQPACVPGGGDPGWRICPFAPRRLRPCACPEPVRSLGGSGARRPGGTLSPSRSTDPPSGGAPRAEGSGQPVSRPSPPGKRWSREAGPQCPAPAPLLPGPSTFSQDELKSSGVCPEGAPRPLPGLSTGGGVNPGRPAPPSPPHPKRTPRPDSPLFSFKENSRTDGEAAAATKRIRKHASGAAVGSRRRDRSPHAASGERAPGMGEPVRGAG